MDVEQGTWSIREGVVYCDGREVPLQELVDRLIESESDVAILQETLDDAMKLAEEKSAEVARLRNERWQKYFEVEAERNNLQEEVERLGNALHVVRQALEYYAYHENWGDVPPIEPDEPQRWWMRGDEHGWAIAERALREVINGCA